MYNVKIGGVDIAEDLDFFDLWPGKIYIVTVVPKGHTVKVGEACLKCVGSLAFISSQQQTSYDTYAYKFRNLRPGETITITG